MSLEASIEAARIRRKKRIRKKVFGTTERPRLSIYRTASHIYAQVIDDSTGTTLAAASTLTSDIRSTGGNKGNIAAAEQVGKLLAERALAAKITHVVFDRNGFLFHGRVKALADAAREGGLGF